MKHELISHKLETAIDKDNLAEYTLELKIAVDDDFARQYVNKNKVSGSVTLTELLNLLQGKA